MSQTNTIVCPECGSSIDIDELFYTQIEKRLQKEYLQKHKTLEDRLKQREESIQEEEANFKKRLDEETKRVVEEERKRVYLELKENLEKEHSSALKRLESELQLKSQQIQELNSAKIEIEQLKRANEELELDIRAKVQREMNDRLKDERLRLQRSLEELNEIKLREFQQTQELKLKEKEQQLEQLRKSLEDAKRKVEQGSTQIQGEALELEIESWLRERFVFDIVEEVKKGVYGADCIQTINTRDLQNCGKICYESKNTKAWNSNWIDKLKQDMLKVKADIGVLVTSVYPTGMDRMGFVDGIWVCSFEEFKGSVSLLREALIMVHTTIQKDENKSDKMLMLYNYLTSNEFKIQIHSIVDGFIQMQNELEKEKRSIKASWSRRQKIIDRVLDNTTQMYGSLQGIAGKSLIAPIEALELDDNDIE